MTTELKARPHLQLPLRWLHADRAAKAIRVSVFRRKYQLQELRDELAELQGTVNRLIEITENVLDALAEGGATRG
jgi:hypothetical protein